MQSLFILLSALLLGGTNGFLSVPSASTTSTHLWSEAQADYGQKEGAQLPGTYAQCGKCQSAFALKEEDLGGGSGRRLECSVCGHSWFQSKNRLMTLNNGFEMIPLPDTDKERIASNIEEGKSPKFTGDSKLYVGNISFDATEDDILEVFSEAGSVGSIALVRDEQGRNRGFGFVTMRTKEEGEAAMEKLNGVDLKGRTLAVRESNN